MATTEQFSLRWNNFHSNMTHGFHDLYEAHDMVDVTIAVDGQCFMAHKLVLAICSPFFKQIFKVNRCEHPIVILKDFTHGNMKDILDFMYLGEVNVLRENLTSFLRTAEVLQVKGLTGDDNSDTSSKKEDKMDMNGDTEDDPEYCQLLENDDSVLMSQYPSPPVPSPPLQKPIPTNHKRQIKNTVPNNNQKKMKQETNTSTGNNRIANKSTEIDDCMLRTDDDSEFIELPSKSDQIFDKDDVQVKKEMNFFDASVTMNSSSDPTGLQDHGKNEAKIGNNNKSNNHFKCVKCAKCFSRRDHLRTHEKNIHGEDAGPFACVICSQLYKNSESLRKHIAKFHFEKVRDLQQKITLKA